MLLLGGVGAQSEDTPNLTADAIRALQANGRMTNQDLAEQVNLSPSPCLRRLRILEDSGAIRGYSAEVDAKAYLERLTGEAPAAPAPATPNQDAGAS